MDEEIIFYDDVKEINDNVLRITIPKIQAEIANIKKGNRVQVVIKKIK